MVIIPMIKFTDMNLKIRFIREEYLLTQCDFKPFLLLHKIPPSC